MKRNNNLIEKIASTDNLNLAFWKARKGKDGMEHVECYRDDLISNLSRLSAEISNGNVMLAITPISKCMTQKNGLYVLLVFQKECCTML